MSAEIQLISDGDGLAVIGAATDVERFLVSEGLPSPKDLGLPRLKTVAGVASAVAKAGSEMSAESGRWVQLTRESADLVHKYGLRQNAANKLFTGVLKGDSGQIRGFVEFAQGPGSFLANPAVLAGVAGIMAQVATKQKMDEIADYLAKIDEKVDDVLRAQKDAALARMIGVAFMIEETMIIRERRGRVDDITWSKVQAAPATIAETQAYALRRLDALAEKLESKSAISDLATTAREARTRVGEWLAVLARSFQLQDAIAVLELDRVLDASPEELHGHRLGLRDARQNRLDLIARSTERLLDRMNTAAARANEQVLTNPLSSPAVVEASNHVAYGIHDFRARLGIETGGRSARARRWVDAAVEVRDSALETGAKGLDAAMSTGAKGLDAAMSTGAKGLDAAIGIGGEALDKAGAVTSMLSSGFAGRLRKLRGDDGQRAIES
ncbi:hypothetical protein KZ829_34035 [Actinoplanes hulinensis]|uniref:Uncharacterized protein n=1 Tax=Actinoplanes hulinensis TaxID=1144547 RepID=A0ABS7BCL9_9ACTN|nr:hypothetical protein [Actinoplanes hulinensis]MBW6438761.1 hypothetical protein [Actinoplanes hulinensis]